MIALIGKGAIRPVFEMLQQVEKQCILSDPEHVMSLTGFLMDHPEVLHIVIWDDGRTYWSDGHVLTAAKLLRKKGGMTLMGEGQLIDRLRSNHLIDVANDSAELMQLLHKDPFSKTHPSGTRREKIPDDNYRILPLAIPDSLIVIIDVIGSQQRIGCTTQSIALWHYCRTLGFDPAVVAAPERIAEIAAPMHGKEIDGGYEIEGVQFVTDTCRTYDCYIRDIGCVPGDLSTDSNCLVLVAGVKPWELENTMRAVRAAHSREVSVLLSFTTQRDCEQLGVLFGSNDAIAAPWLPDPWHPSRLTLMTYDKLMRSKIQKMCKEE